jgi:hypothetical protein
MLLKLEERRSYKNDYSRFLHTGGKGCIYLLLLVGAGRFERPTPCAQGRCATRLRYAPTALILHCLKSGRSAQELSCDAAPTVFEPKQLRSLLVLVHRWMADRSSRSTTSLTKIHQMAVRQPLAQARRQQQVLLRQVGPVALYIRHDVPVPFAVFPRSCGILGQAPRRPHRASGTGRDWEGTIDRTRSRYSAL